MNAPIVLSHISFAFKKSGFTGYYAANISYLGHDVEIGTDIADWNEAETARLTEFLEAVKANLNTIMEKICFDLVEENGLEIRAMPCGKLFEPSKISAENLVLESIWVHGRKAELNMNHKFYLMFYDLQDIGDYPVYSYFGSEGEFLGAEIITG